MANVPLPPVLRNNRPISGQYKLAGIGGYGLDVAIGEPEIDTARMAVKVIYADGNRRDGVGDLLEVEGIQLWRHKINQICLWDHGKVQGNSGTTLPIGTCEDPSSKEYCNYLDGISKTARAWCFFYQKDNEHGLFCEQLFDMVVKRIIRGGSIGYQTIKSLPLQADYQTGTPPGQHLLVTLMLEFSLVVLPANGDTVLKGFSSPAAYDEWAEGVRRTLSRGTLVCGKALSPVLYKSLTACIPAETKVVSGYEGKDIPRSGTGSAAVPLANLPDTKIPHSRWTPGAGATCKKTNKLRAKYMGVDQEQLATDTVACVGACAVRKGKQWKTVQRKSIAIGTKYFEIRKVRRDRDGLEGWIVWNTDANKQDGDQVYWSEAEARGHLADAMDSLGNDRDDAPYRRYKGITITHRNRVTKGVPCVAMKFDTSGMSTEQQNSFVKDMATAGFGKPKGLGGRWTDETKSQLSSPMKAATFAFDLQPNGDIPGTVSKAVEIAGKHGAKFVGSTKSLNQHRQEKDMPVKQKKTLPNAGKKSASNLISMWQNGHPRDWNADQIKNEIASLSGDEIKQVWSAAGMSGPTTRAKLVQMFENRIGSFTRSTLKSVTAKTKAIPGNGMAEEQEEDAAIDANMDVADIDESPVDELAQEPIADVEMADEPYGAQVLRWLYEVRSTLLAEGDERMAVLENEEVSKHLTEELEHVAEKLGELEELFKQEYESEIGDGKASMDDKDADGVDDADEADALDDALPADSDPLDEESLDAAVEGMDTKRLKGQLGKALRKLYGKKSYVQRLKDGKWYVMNNSGNGVEAGPFSSEEEARAKMASWKNPLTGKNIKAKKKGICAECSKSECKCGSKDLTGDEADQIADEMVEQTEDTEKALEPHEKKAVGGAAEYLKGVGEMAEPFGDTHRKDAYFHAKTLEPIGTQMEDPSTFDLQAQGTLPVPPQEGINPPDQNGVKDLPPDTNPTEAMPDTQAPPVDDGGMKGMGCRKSIGKASRYLKALSEAADYNDDHRQKSMGWHKTLSGFATEQALPEVAQIEGTAEPSAEVETKGAPVNASQWEAASNYERANLLLSAASYMGSQEAAGLAKNSWEQLPSDIRAKLQAARGIKSVSDAKALKDDALAQKKQLDAMNESLKRIQSVFA